MHFLELVPHDLDRLSQHAEIYLKQFPQLDGINVPDILRVEHRSYTAAAALLKHGITTVPHIRRIDHPISKTIEIISALVDKGLKHVLIVKGDLPQNMQDIFDIKAETVISTLKKKLPELKVYAAIDQYRQSFKSEYDYCQEKIDAGCDGFFTQPFFHPDFAKVYLDQIRNSNIFIGFSPVVTEKSFNYWVNRNNAVFPKNFEYTLEHNARIAKELIKITEDYNQHTYHMPIRVNVADYLAAVFGTI